MTADQPSLSVSDLQEQLMRQAHELDEAREERAALAEVLRVIASSPDDLMPVFQAMLSNAVRICEASYGVLFRFESGAWSAAAMHGVPPDFAEFWQRGAQRPGPRTALGRVAEIKQTVHIADVTAEPAYVEGEPIFVAAVNLGRFRTILNVPVLKDNELIGAFAIYRQEVRPFAEKQIELVQNFAAQAVIAIENTRLLNELRRRTDNLTESLEQQTATSEILRVISSSRTDLQPVFDTIVASAVRLCGARMGAVFRFDGKLIHLVAHHNYTPEVLEVLHRTHPRPPKPDQVSGRAILTRAVVQVGDTLADPNYLHEMAHAGNWRSILGVPVLHADVPIGVIVITRNERGPFSDGHINLLKSFAAQAVIAIENARLLNELRTRTDELARSVGELRALGEVGQAVNSTLDVETVLRTIVTKAVELSTTDAGAIYVFDEERQEFRLHATYGMREAMIAAIRDRHIGMGDANMGEAARRREPIQIADLREAPASALNDVILGAGYRALLVVPLLGADRIVGALVVRRKQPGAFPQSAVDLLQTFADQSVLAIQNARLFREIEEKGRELEIASRHKSQFVANMSHELRTPLAAVLGYAELMQEGIYEPLGDKSLAALARIRSNGKHLLGLINTVLDIAKIESGQFTLNMTEYSIETVVETVRAATESLAQNKKLALTTAVPKSLPIGIGDEQRLTQVLLNLVGNAIKFTDTGEVRVIAEAVDGHFAISVVDTGPGAGADANLRAIPSGR
jgi:GAF domain-containing protein